MRNMCILLLLLFVAVAAHGQSILLVDDDAAAGYGNEFPGTMDRTGYSGYSVWSVGDSALIGPDSTVLFGYDVVIWNQSDFATTRGITEADTAAMGAYLNHGGKLWLNANNFFAILLYYYGWTPPSWMPVTTYDLPSSFWLDTLYGVPGDPITDGLVIPIDRNLTTNDMESDTFSTATATICFDHNVTSHSALRNDGYLNGGQLFFLAAPFEGIATDALKDTLFKRTMIWFGFDVRFKDIAAVGITSPAALVSADDSIAIAGQFRSLSQDSLVAVPVVATVSNGGSIVYSDTVTMDTIAPDQIKSVTFRKLYWPVFDTLQLTCKVAYSQDMWPANDSISKQFVTVPGLRFSDDFEYGFSRWTGDWALTTERAQSGTHSLTDWPNHDYPINSDRFVCLDTVFNLTGFSSARLLFSNVHWIETGYDHGYVMISQDGGVSWDSIATFTGVDSIWHAEDIDLTTFLSSSNFRLGFRLGSDALLNMKGWFIDDIIFTAVPVKTLTGIDGEPVNARMVSGLTQIAPNPSSGAADIGFQVGRDNSRVSLKVYNLAGQLVRTVHEGAMNAGSHHKRLDGSNLSAGVYFVRLKVNGFAATKRLTVLR